MGTDASSLSPEDVIDTLERFVRLFVAEHDPLNYNPFLVKQADGALTMVEQWRSAQLMKVIPNFEDVVDDTTLDEIHDYYAEYDIADDE